MYFEPTYLGLFDSPTDTRCAELYPLSVTVTMALRDILRDNPTRQWIDGATYGQFRPEDADVLREWAACANKQDECTLLTLADEVAYCPAFRLGQSCDFPELREPLYDYD